MVYDAAGRKIAVVDALLNRSTTVYDFDNRVIRQITPLLQRTRSTYDAAGRQVALQDGNGKGREKVSGTYY